MYPVPGFLSRHLNGSTVRTTWMLRIGTVLLPFPPLIQAYSGSLFQPCQGHRQGCGCFLVSQRRKISHRFIRSPSQNGTGFFGFKQHKKPWKEEERDALVEKMKLPLLCSRSPLPTFLPEPRLLSYLRERNLWCNTSYFVNCLALGARVHIIHYIFDGCSE